MKKMKVEGMLRYIVLFGFLTVCMAAFGTAGCNSSSSDGSSDDSVRNSTISGTAAAGAPIIGTITIKDSSFPAITETHDIKADGSYSFGVSGMTGPFLFQVNGEVGGRNVTYHSAGTEADKGGCINVTPLTDLIVSNIATQQSKV